MSGETLTQPPPSHEEILIDEKEAARRLSISPRHLRKYDIPIVRLGRRKLYDPKDLKAVRAQQAKEWTEQVPPRFLLNTVEGIVYFIDCEAYTKIGFTAHPLLRRFKHWRNGNPFNLKIFALMPGTTELEQSLHKRFARLRVQLEWFDLGKAERDFIQTLAASSGGMTFDNLIIGAPKIGMNAEPTSCR